MTAATAALARPGAPGRVRAPIRVLIVDDSIVARAVIARTIEAEHDMIVVGQAGNGRAALDLLTTCAVDVIILDLVMPGCCGFEALPALIAAGGRARVLVVSSAAAAGAEETLAALRLGAADTLLKPTIGSGKVFAEALIDRLRRLAADPEPAATFQVPAPIPPDKVERGAADVGCVAIGASTGGVHALAAFFGVLSREMDAPILITQHLPAPFMTHFARQLADMAGRAVRVADDGMPIEPRMILLAPGDASLSLIPSGGLVRVALERERAASGCLPSVDPMFSAVARIYGGRAIGIMLSGMGRDGLVGAHALCAAGGTLLAQDAATSVVWGMPGAVVQAGLATSVLSPEQLAWRLGAMARARRERR